EHAAPARPLGLRLIAVFPQTHAARGHLRITFGAVDVRIEAPALPARLRIDRDHDVGAGFKIQRPVGKYRRGLEGELARAGETGAVLAGLVGPHRLQARDVAAIDLIETGEALSEA